jgi:hypothetical protein
MGKGTKSWHEDKLDISKAHFVMPHHDSISLQEFQRFVALGLCNKGKFHRSTHLNPPPFIRTKVV